MSYLPFITDEKLVDVVSEFLNDIEKIQSQAPMKFRKSTLDPFSAVLFSLCCGKNLSDWLDNELHRQIGKSFQNKIGELHQNILGNCDGCEVVDDIIDIRNVEKKVIAEIKNKYNTTKGSDRKTLYDNLSIVLQQSEYSNFTGYYVEIIPKDKQRYNNCFTPSDNTSRKNRPCREDIRIVDGYTFYGIITGYEDAIKMVYDILPKVINDITGSGIEIKSEPLFEKLFNRTY